MNEKLKKINVQSKKLEEEILTNIFRLFGDEI
jgi:hypothetical protein